MWETAVVAWGARPNQFLVQQCTPQLRKLGVWEAIKGEALGGGVWAREQVFV